MENVEIFIQPLKPFAYFHRVMVFIFQTRYVYWKNMIELEWAGRRVDHCNWSCNRIEEWNVKVSVYEGFAVTFWKVL